MDSTVSESVVDATDAPASTASYRNLTPDEIAALDIEAVKKNNSASADALVRKQPIRTSTPD